MAQLILLREIMLCFIAHGNIYCFPPKDSGEREHDILYY